MSISTRLEAINQHLLDDYSILTLGGADLTNVDKNIQNLKTQWKSRLEYYLSNGLDVVWNNWNKVSASGTTLSINNTIQAPMKIVYGGNTQQNGDPTPDSPIPVQVVTGDNEVKVEGKNLIPFTNQDFTLNNVRYYVQDGNLILNGTSTSETLTSNAKFKEQFSFTLKAGTYYFDRGSVLSNIPIATSIKKYSDNTDLKQNSGTFTLNEDTQVYLGFYVYNKTFTNLQTNIMLNISSTKETYTPYVSQTYPINLGSMELCKIGDYQDYIAKSTGKNLINSLEYHRSCNSSTGAVSTPSSSTNSYLSIEDYVNVKPNTTYTVSFQHDDLTGNLFIGTKDINGNFIERLGLGAVRTFTTGSNVRQIFIFIYKSGENYTIDGWTQLVEGTTALPYEPYGKVWYKYGAIGKVVLDGSESWSERAKAGTHSKQFYCYTGIQNFITSTEYCNYFRYNYASYNYSQAGDFAIDASGNNKRIYCGVSDDLTLANFETLIGTNNLIAYYVLATPTYTKITDELLTYQLEQIKYSYSSQTNISQTNNDMPFILDVVALGN